MKLVLCCSARRSTSGIVSVKFPDHMTNKSRTLSLSMGRGLFRFRGSGCPPVGEGVSEMRVHVGPGYRVYFARQGKVVYVLLCGGDKSSQKHDIKKAKALAKQLEEPEL